VAPDPDARQPPLHPYVRQLAIQAATDLGLAI